MCVFLAEMVRILTRGVPVPIAELIAVCHARGVLVLIDGAHALGQIPLNMSDIGADFYLSNGTRARTPLCARGRRPCR